MEFLCMGFFVLCVIGGIIMIYHFNAKEAAEKGRTEALKAYTESLEMLKRDPQNPDLRAKALALGRTRVKVVIQGVLGGIEAPLRDEAALMNDITAACARAGSKSPGEEEQRKPTIEERLVKLDELRAKQLISEQEHQTRRQQILAEL